MTDYKKHRIIFCTIFLCLAMPFAVLACVAACMPKNFVIVLHFPEWLCLLLLSLYAIAGVTFGIITQKKHKIIGYVTISVTAVIFITIIGVLLSLKSDITFINEYVTVLSLTVIQVLCLYYSLTLFCFGHKTFGTVLLILSFVICFVWIGLAFSYSFLGGNGYLLYNTKDGISLLFKGYNGLHDSNLSSIYQKKSVFVYEIIKELPNNNVSVNISWLDKHIGYFDGGFSLDFENFTEYFNYLY